MVPSPRDSHVSVVFKDSMFVFGGSTGINQSNEPNFYEYNFQLKRWYQVESNNQSAPSRFCHTGAISNKALYIFGGYDGTTRLNDIYIFHFEPDIIDVPKSTILEEMGSFVDNQLFSDVKFSVAEGKIIHAHKLMLCRSPYFKAMFTNEMKEKNQTLIKLPRIKY